MPSQLLTDTQVRSLKPNADRQYEVWDSKVTGLGIRVSPKGAKSWVVLYRAGRRPRRLTLGRYPILSISDARQRAQEALREATLGGDPAFDRKHKRAHPLEFSALVENYIVDFAKPINRSWAENERILKRDFSAFWGRRDVRQITRSDVTSRIDSISSKGGPSAATHAFAHIRRFFNWMVERGLIDVSPCQGLRPPSKSNSRDRVLSDAELASIWEATSKMDYPFGLCVQIMILTGQRRNEVASMMWQELDLERGVWSLPSARTKANRAHEVPLSTQAVSVIEEMPKLHENYVFPARGKDKPISGFSKWKNELDRLSSTSGWVLHDLRRTTATGLARLKVPPHVVERILNHTSGTFGGVAGVYNRFGYLDEMRVALQQWADHVERLAIPSPCRSVEPENEATA